jgi:hypothetical protein
VPASAETRFHVIHVPGTEDEGVKQLGLAAVDFACRVGEFVEWNRYLIGSGRRVVVVGAVVDSVVPARGTYARA